MDWCHTKISKTNTFGLLLNQERVYKLIKVVHAFHCFFKRLHCFFLFCSLAIFLILKTFFKWYILLLKLLFIFCLSVLFNSENSTKKQLILVINSFLYFKLLQVSIILDFIQNLTRWLPTTSILVVIGRIYHYQFKCNYLKN